jgi:hypothetical protein
MLKEINHIHLKLEFTIQKENGINFLDITIMNNKSGSEFLRKPTANDIIYIISCHPEHKELA